MCQPCSPKNLIMSRGVPVFAAYARKQSSTFSLSTNVGQEKTFHYMEERSSFLIFRDTSKVDKNCSSGVV